MTVFQEIAKNPKAGTTVFSRNKTHTIPEVFTKGRKVYNYNYRILSHANAPGVQHGALFPIITKASSPFSSSFIVDAKYWSANLVSNFTHGTLYFSENENQDENEPDYED